MKRQKIMVALIIILLSAMLFACNGTTQQAVTVEFDSNGGSAVASKSVNVGSDFAFEVPTKANYDFVAWKTVDGTAITDSDGRSLDKWTASIATTIHAEWVLHNYKVTYTNLQNVENDNIVTFTYETATVTLNGLPDTNGQKFVEWQDKAGKKVASIEKGTDKDLELTAVWTNIQYSLTFVLGDGEYADQSNQQSYTIESAFEFVAAVPNAIGYEFDGWYNAQTAGEKVNGIVSGTVGNKTFYARYKLIQYKINYVFEIDGVFNNNPNFYTVETGAIALNAPIRGGYPFILWEDENGDSIDTIVIDPQNLGEITITAVWGDAILYTISYTNTYGKPNDNPTSYTADTETIELSGLEDREYHYFAGWYTAEVGGIKIMVIAKGSFDNRVLHAQWKPIECDINYENADGATHSNPATYNIETETIVLENAEKDGYTFIGWFDSLENGSEVTEIAKGSFGAITLYARWASIEYDINYENTFGLLNENVTEYNIETDTIELLALSGRAGYDFVGWFDSLENGAEVTEITKGSFGDITLYAIWDAIEYEVYYEFINLIEEIGFEFTIIENVTHNYPTTYTVETDTIILPEVEIGGYAFVGWIKIIDISTYEYIEIDEIAKGSTGDIFLVAVMEIVTYSISYENTFGLLNENMTEYDVETDTIELLALSGREGYDFVGWFDSLENGAEVTEITKGSIGDITLYAIWDAIEYEVYYEFINLIEEIGFEFTIIENVTHNYPTTYTVETDTIILPEVEIGGYAFVGWIKIIDISTYEYIEIEEIAKGSTGDIILYAGMEIVAYSISYENTFGLLNENMTEYDVETDTIELLALSGREGYDFIGWFDSLENGDEVTEITEGSFGDITLYARWSAHDHQQQSDLELLWAEYSEIFFEVWEEINWCPSDFYFEDNYLGWNAQALFWYIEDGVGFPIAIEFANEQDMLDRQYVLNNSFIESIQYSILPNKNILVADIYSLPYFLKGDVILLDNIYITSNLEVLIRYIGDDEEYTTPNTITIIGYGAFASCTNLTSIVINEGVTIISAWTFTGCMLLTSIVIPESVTTIDIDAFFGVGDVSAIFYMGDAQSWLNIDIDYDENDFDESIIYYYSETENTDGQHWHYDNGVPTIWE